MKKLNTVLIVLLLSNFQLFSQTEITNEDLYDYEVLVNHLVKYQGNLISLSMGDSTTLFDAESFFNSTSEEIYNDLVGNNTSVEEYHENILTGGKRNYNYNNYFFQKNIQEKSMKIFIPRTITIFDSNDKVEDKVEDNIEIKIDKEFNQIELKISSIKKVEEIPDLSEYINYKEEVDGVLNKRNRKRLEDKNDEYSDDKFDEDITKIMIEYVKDYLLIQNSKVKKTELKKKSYLGNFTKDAEIQNDLDNTSNELISRDLYAFKISESTKISEFVGAPKISLTNEESRKRERNVNLEGEVMLLKKVDDKIIKRKCMFEITRYRAHKKKEKKKFREFKITNIESLPYIKDATNHYLSAKDKEMARNGVQNFFNKFILSYKKLQATPLLKDQVLNNYFSSLKSSVKFYDPNTETIKKSNVSEFLDLISSANIDKKNYGIHFVDDWSKVIVHEGEDGKNAPYIVARVRDTITSDRSICITERNFTIRFSLENGNLSSPRISGVIFKNGENPNIVCHKANVGPTISPVPSTDTITWPPRTPIDITGEYGQVLQAIELQARNKLQTLHDAIIAKSKGEKVDMNSIQRLFLEDGNDPKIRVTNHSEKIYGRFGIIGYFNHIEEDLRKKYKKVNFEFIISNSKILPSEMPKYDYWIAPVKFTQVFKGIGKESYCDEMEKTVYFAIRKEANDYVVYIRDIWHNKTTKIDCDN